MLKIVNQLLSHVQLSATPRTVSPPGSFVQRNLQIGIPEWVAIPFSRGSSRPRDRTWVSCIAGGFSLPLSCQGSPKSNVSFGYLMCILLLSLRKFSSIPTQFPNDYNVFPCSLVLKAELWASCFLWRTHVWPDIWYRPWYLPIISELLGSQRWAGFPRKTLSSNTFWRLWIFALWGHF